MGKIKQWMMDMDTLVGDAFEIGYWTEDEIITYVKARLSPCDDRYVAEAVEKYKKAVAQQNRLNADYVDGFSADDLGESPDY